MKKFTSAVLSVCLLASVVITGCHSSQQLLNPRLSLKSRTGDQQPQFISDINLNNNSKTISVRPGAPSSEKEKKEPVLINESGYSLTNVLQHRYSELLGIVPQAITNLTLYSFIDDWYGVRYRLGGNDKSGIDCSAFVQRLYENVFCTNLFRTAFEQFSNCKMVKSRDSLKEGDLVFFRTRGKRRPISHVGIYLSNNFFVHASSTQGVVISSLNEDYWSRFYVGAGKIPAGVSSF